MKNVQTIREDILRTVINGQGGHATSCTKNVCMCGLYEELMFIEKYLDRVEKQTREETIESLRIGDLRQWINELPANYVLITDEQIRVMLGIDKLTSQKEEGK